MKSRFTFCSLLFSLILLGGCSGSSSSGSSGSVPLIYSFVAMPSTVDLGESVELSWSANGATSYSISGMSGAVTSPLTVSPPATTTYTLTATNAEGSAFASTVVTVNRQPPTISNFTATPSTISQGASSGLSWSVSNATSVTLSGISGTASSPTVVSPATSTTYTLTAANAAGSITAQATVTVTPAISVSIAPGNMTLSSGASGSFTASVLNDAQNAGVNWSLGGGLGTLLSATSTSVLYYAPAELPAASSATLTATSKSDTTKSASVTITLSAPTAPASQWVYYDTTGKLNYKPLNAHGDQIMDFSTCS